MRYLALFALCLCAILCVTTANADPTTDGIAFQGRLTDATDTPVPDGSRELIISIWTDSIGGTMLHNEIVVITTSKGLYSTCIGCGSSTFPDIFDSQTLFLQTQLVGQVPMTPRTRLRSVPYALSSSSVHSEWTNGVARGRGIVANRPSSGNPHGIIILDHDSDGDGHEDFIVTDSVSGEAASSFAGHDINSDGVVDVKWNITVRPDRIEMLRRWKAPELNSPGSQIAELVDADSATLRMSYDLDGDGVWENELSQSADQDKSSVSVKSSRKQYVLMQAFPQRWRVDAHDSDTASYVSSVLESDLNTDGVAESRISQSTDTSGATQRLEKKGINAVNVKLAITSSTAGDEARHSLTNDSDGDGVIESSSTQAVNSDSVHFSQQKKIDGTPARLSTNFTITKQSQSVELGQQFDENSDGFAETEMSSTVERKSGSIIYLDREGNEVLRAQVGVDSTRGILTTDRDSDGDGVPEDEAYMRVEPGRAYHAIKTKGTGAESNRVIGATDDTTATMELATDSASISLRTRKGGVIKGSININHASTMRVSLDSDGNGYFATGVGVGVEPTHPFQAAGGAFCDGTTWINASDANAKENFQPVDGEELLEKISGLEITRWKYKGDSEIEHIGPTAQDFQETFGVGSDGKSISTIDPSGIALAAIKELNKQNQMLQEKSTDLQKQNEELRREMNELKAMIRKLASDK